MSRPIPGFHLVARKEIWPAIRVPILGNFDTYAEFEYDLVGTASLVDGVVRYGNHPRMDGINLLGAHQEIKSLQGDWLVKTDDGYLWFSPDQFNERYSKLQ